MMVHTLHITLKITLMNLQQIMKKFKKNYMHLIKKVEKTKDKKRFKTNKKRIY